jgi:hypothetical protein
MAFLLVKTALLSLGLNYGVHYTSARMYDTMCVPHALSEILQSLASTASPVCGLLLHTMTSTQSNYGIVLTATITSVMVNALKPA